MARKISKTNLFSSVFPNFHWYFFYSNHNFYLLNQVQYEHFFFYWTTNKFVAFVRKKEFEHLYFVSFSSRLIFHSDAIYQISLNSVQILKFTNRQTSSLAKNMVRFEVILSHVINATWFQKTWKCKFISYSRFTIKVFDKYCLS